MYGRVEVAKEVVVHHRDVDLSVVSIKELGCFASERRVANDCTDTAQLVFELSTSVCNVDMVPLFPSSFPDMKAVRNLSKLAAVRSWRFEYGREAPLCLTALDTYQFVIDVSPLVRYLLSKV